MPRLILIAIVVAVAVLLWRRIFANSLFKIEVRGGRIQISGGVPGYADSDVRQFISHLGLQNGSVIRGVRGGERYRLEFSGAVSEDDQQRVRNFFYLKF